MHSPKTENRIPIRALLLFSAYREMTTAAPSLLHVIHRGGSSIDWESDKKYIPCFVPGSGLQQRATCRYLVYGNYMGKLCHTCGKKGLL